MQLLKNRKFAMLVLVLCVFVSIFGFGGASIAEHRNAVLDVFEEGVDPSLPVRSSMDAYLENCANYARIMAEEVRLHVDQNNAIAARALTLTSVVGGENALSERHEAQSELTSLVESMYTDMYAAGLTEEQRTAFTSAYRNFSSELKKIQYDGYHQLAADFNAEISGFPANIISSLRGLGRLDAF